MKYWKVCSLLKIKTVLFVFLLFSLNCFLSASEIKFSGGYTRASLQDSNKRVELSGGANAETDSLAIVSDNMLIYGEDYRYVECTGNVKATEKDHMTEISAGAVFYDREENRVISDGWIEINDPENEAILSGAWFEFSLDERVITLQIRASITKITEKGTLSCTADSIEYRAEEQTLELKGNAKIKWGSDSYSATYVLVDIDTEDVTLHGSIEGEIHGE